MKNNVFKKHRDKVLAREGAEKSAASPHGDATAYELRLAELGNHKRRLKTIKSRDRKIQLKQELLPGYMPYVEGVLEAGTGAQDNVLMTMMVWAIDVGNWNVALTIGAYALEHKLKTPDQYNRDLVDLLAEELAEQVILQHGNPELDIEPLEQVQALTAEMDMIDQVRAKVHKGLGLVYAKRTEIDKAIPHLEVALKLNDRCGVKKLLDSLIKKADKEKAEQEKAEQEKAEQEKAEQEKAELEKAELEKAEQEKAELEKAEQEKAELEKAELERAELERAEPEKAELEKAELDKAELKKTETKTSQKKSGQKPNTQSTTE